MSLNADAMFYRLWDVSVARNAKQAVGFYGAHLLVVLLLFLLLSVAVELVMTGHPLQEMLRAQFVGAMVVSILYVAVLGAWIMVRKGLMGSLHCWIVLAAGVAAAFMGTLLGLLAPAYLSILRPLQGAVNETGGNEP